MKSTRHLLILVAGTTFICSHSQAAITLNPDGLRIGSDAEILPDTVNSREGMDIMAYEGQLSLYGGFKESSAWALDGGVMLLGSPMRFILGASAGSGSELTDGNLEVWAEGDAFGFSTALPLFKINSTDNTAAFNGLAVNVATGSLSVSGSPVLTQTSIKAQTKLEVGSTASATGAGAVAFGASVTAGGAESFVTGSSSTASGNYACSFGNGSDASGNNAASFSGSNGIGQNSFAAGQSSATSLNSTALSTGGTYGEYSLAAGPGSQTSAYGEIALGAFNTTVSANSSAWIATDRIFVVGNGTTWGSANASNAIVTKKNGQTNLINKYWSASSPMADLSGNANANGGEALVVSGATRLKGKIVIEVPQGDISMGIYTP